MTAEFDNTNRGVLFKNTEKQSEKSPDYLGKINFDGTEMYLSAWLKTSSKGVKYMSLAVKPKQEKVDRSKPIGQALGDEIPFMREDR